MEVCNTCGCDKAKDSPACRHCGRWDCWHPIGTFIVFDEEPYAGETFQEFEKQGEAVEEESCCTGGAHRQRFEIQKPCEEYE